MYDIANQISTMYVFATFRVHYDIEVTLCHVQSHIPGEAKKGFVISNPKLAKIRIFQNSKIHSTFGVGHRWDGLG